MQSRNLGKFLKHGKNFKAVAGKYGEEKIWQPSLLNIA